MWWHWWLVGGLVAAECDIETWQFLFEASEQAEEMGPSLLINRLYGDEKTYPVEWGLFHKARFPDPYETARIQWTGRSPKIWQILGSSSLIYPEQLLRFLLGVFRRLGKLPT